jgi:DNA-binding MarR family transcriptional regulator
MTYTKQIIEYLNQNPSRTATEVAQALNMKLSTAKVTLGKLAKEGRLVREKVESANYVRGPKNIQVYSVNT